MRSDALILAALVVGFTAGLWWLIEAVRGRDPDEVRGPSMGERWPGARKFARRAILGVALGVVTVLVTRWWAVGAGVAAMVTFWPQVWGGARSERAKITELEALAVWVEALRDTITAAALPEALMSTCSHPPAQLEGPLRRVVERMRHQEPLRAILRDLAGDLNDPIADEVIAALLLNATTQGRRLQAVLTSMGETTRGLVETRRMIEAQRRATRWVTRATVVLTVTVMTAGSLAFPSYAAAYREPTGQVVMAVIVSLFAAAFAYIGMTSRISTPARFLAPTVGGGSR